MRLFVAAVAISIATSVPLTAGRSELPKPLLSESLHLDGKGSINTARGRRTIEVREITATASWKESFLIFVLFDPETKTYSGRIFSSIDGDPDGNIIKNYLSCVAVFLHDSQLYEFSLKRNLLQLEVRHSGEKAIDLGDAARRVLKGVQPADVLESAGLNKNLILVSLPELKNFDAPNGASVSTKLPVVEEVALKSGQWKLVLNGQWREEVTLDSDYRFLSMRRLD